VLACTGPGTAKQFFGLSGVRMGHGATVFDAPFNWRCWRQEGLMTLPFWFDRFLWLMLIVVAVSGMVLID
jgi:hypothetical protein